jgi:predicted N-acetyltransferase YhbS
VTTTLSTLTIRQFTDDDYADYTRLHNALYVEFGKTEESFRFNDGARPAKCQHKRWVAERGGRVVGYGQYDQLAHIWDPRKFAVEIAVDGECLQQGIGSALYRTIVDALRPFDPIGVDTWSREDRGSRWCRWRSSAARRG